MELIDGSSNSLCDLISRVNDLIEWYNDCELERIKLKDIMNTKYGTGINAALFTYQDTDTIKEEIEAGDVIVDIRTNAIYVCTHVISPDSICYDTRLEMIENARSRYGMFEGERKNFRLYAKRNTQ